MNEKSSEEVMVSIWCTAYNHSKYIRQCLDGFVMQKTDFRFEVIVHDDASTDSTADIIREYEQKYPDTIKPIYQQVNQYSQKNVRMINVFFLPKARGKYIAICEGDDYWIDPLKLQKQVDFLEKNREYSICCHRFYCFDQEKNRMREDGHDAYFPENREGISFDLDFNFNCIWLTKTLSSLFRKTALNVFVNKEYSSARDTILFYYVLKEGKGYCFNGLWGCYREHLNGAFSKISILKHHRVLYDTYKEMYEMEKDQVLKRKMYNEFFNLFLCSMWYRDFHIHASYREIMSLFYYIPLKLLKYIGCK